MLKGFHQQETNITLYLKLTRKNVDALSIRDLGSKCQSVFNRFCIAYEALESQYYDGIDDHRLWANDIKNLAATLMKSSEN